MKIPHVEKTVLDNGIKVITENIPTLRSVALGVMVGAGSGDELSHESGLTHFIEHMAFKGTKKRSAFDIASELDAVGGRMNAYTSKEYTVYYSVVLDRHLDIAADVMTDIFLNPLLKEEDIAMEKGVILEEINMYEDTPDELIHDMFAAAILHGHPVGRSTLGTKEDVSGFKRDHFMQYRERLYTPDNLIISAAGDLKHKDLLDMVNRTFKEFNGSKNAAVYPIPEMKGEIRVKRKHTEQVHLCLGTKGLSQLDEDRYALSIMETILGGSMSSWLFQEVREKRGLAYSIFTSAMPFRDFGVFYVYAGTEKKNMKQVIDVTLEQFGRMKREGLSNEELARAKEHLKGGLVLGLESSSARMSYIAKSEFYHGKCVTIDEIFEKIDRVTREDILRIAGRLFGGESLTLTMIGDIGEAPVKTLSC